MRRLATILAAIAALIALALPFTGGRDAAPAPTATAHTPRRYGDSTNIFRTNDAKQNVFDAISLGESSSVTVGGGGATANLFVDSTGGTCTRNASPASYSDAAACSSFDAANDACQNGDTVIIEAGSYGSQSITGSDSRTSMCTMTAASGQTVTLTLLETLGDWLTLKDITIPTGTTGGRGWQTDEGAGHVNGSHVTLDNVDITGPEATVLLVGGSNITWQNSQLGTSGNTTRRLCSNGNGAPFQIDASTNVTIRQADFYQIIPDLNTVTCGGDIMHLEDVRINGDTHGVDIDQSRFWNGSGDGTARIFSSGSGITNLHVTNTYLGVADGSDGNRDTSVQVGAGTTPSCVGFVFAYDTVYGALDDHVCPTLPKYYGLQASSGGGCQGSGGGGGNLWVHQTDANGTCSGDTWLVDPAHACNFGGACQGVYLFDTDGYHLTSSSPARTQGGETTQCAIYTGGVDIDGRARAHTSPCQPGADEFGN